MVQVKLQFLSRFSNSGSVCVITHSPFSPLNHPPQSEIELSQVLLTRFVKRIATDKVVIAFATLLILGIVGIVTYSVLNPDQQVFNVPDVVKPNTAALTDAVNSIGSPSPSPNVRRLLRFTGNEDVD